MSVFIGKKFKIISNGTVSHAEILDIEDEFAIVLIDGKRFKMDKKKLIKKFSDYEVEKNTKSKSQCENCMEYRNGNCIGNKHICEDFRLAPEISREEMDRWPKYGSVSRSRSDKSINREYDNMYEYY